ncbi:MAG TPA: histidine phosphatase family protein [Acidimicrobiales bacterium]|nr:histidine phosphatase family protein [Acidimicrobiales bacterium]
MGRLLLVRHGQSTWNAAGRWQGWADPPLTELGEDQARAAGRALAASGANFAVVASSTLARARRTAELMAAEIAYRGELLTEPELREQDMGEWTGLDRDQIEHRWPGALAMRRAGKTMSVPGGETGEEFEQRCLRAFSRLLVLADQPVLAVCHGGVLVALERLLKLGPHPSGHANLTGWLVSDDSGDLAAIEHVELTGHGRGDLSYGAVEAGEARKA